MVRPRIALAQINSTVGDLQGNTSLIIDFIDRARSSGADLVAFPELAITGYPPEDLLLKPSFIRGNRQCLTKIAAASRGIVTVVGFVDEEGDIYNAAAAVCDGQILTIYRKLYLPNYGVFDEDRYFLPGGAPSVIKIGEAVIGINVCEDIWYPTGPLSQQSQAGAEIIININASPFHMGKTVARERMVATRASDHTVIVCYVNMVGGQDELVFDGSSFICDPLGEVIARAGLFREELLVADLPLEDVFRARLRDPRRRKERAGSAHAASFVKRIVAPDFPQAASRIPIEPRIIEPIEMAAEVYGALVLGLHDYVLKNGFTKVLIALSGGIDSALVATIAVDALGAENVTGVSLPSRYSSDGSKDDARDLAENLGIAMHTIPIEQMFTSALELLEDQFRGTESNVAEENLQARIRFNLMMALSNKFNQMLLTTGNKSEMAVGYATLYGDMCGGIAVIKDVPKLLVYELSAYRNSVAGRPLIPLPTITKAPSAELRSEQLDTDSLPPYEILDPILESYVELDRTKEEIVALGFDPATIDRVMRLVDRAEYKRRQAAPGIKITPRAFGRDRRMPITNRFLAAR